MTEAALIHPEDDVLHALSVGQLTEPELALISAHLADCPACCHRIDQLATDDRLLTRLQQCVSSRDEALVGPAQRRSAVRALRKSHQSRSGLRIRDHDAVTVMLPTPTQVGDYDILAEVGRGGMGVVYKARHRGLNRLTALKMVLAGQFASSAQELRFRLEAELAARVQHPHIVQIYEIGNYDGRPFLAMEWIEGGSLADRLVGKPWSPTEAAALIETLARAINVAHDQGVVHRDLKPGNILLQKVERREQKGENRIDGPSKGCGIPAFSTDYRLRTTDYPSSTDYCLLTTDYSAKITDFGLALTIERGQTMTQSGFLVGTPGYMAPEQAAGKRALVGPATDIYALGVMLYQLLTGQLPFQAESTLELLRAVTSDEPARPRRLQPSVPLDLEAITLHCLEKEPARRYSSALELADDLRRFQAGETIAVRPPSRIERLRKFVRRNKAIVGGAVATGLALLVGTVFSLLFAMGETRQRREAEENAHEADRARHSALRETYQARLSATMMALREGNVREAALQLEAAPSGLRGWEWQHLHARVSDLSPILLSAGPEFDELVTYFPPGKALIARKGDRFVLVDVQRRAVLREVCNTASFRGIVRSPSGLMMAYKSPQGGTMLLDENGTETNISVSWESEHVATSRDRKLVALWQPQNPNDRRLRLVELPSGRLRLTLDAPKWLHMVAFSPDGTRLAGGSDEPGVLVWDTATGKKTVLQGHAAEVYSVAFHPDGKRLVSGSLDKTIRQWDLDANQTIDVRRGHAGQVMSVTYSPDGEWIASSDDERSVRIWKTNDSEPPTVLPDHMGPVFESFFSSDGLTISTGCGSELQWRIWPTPAAANQVVLRDHSSFLYSVVHSPDGRLLASAGWDNDHGIRLWDAASGELVTILIGHTDVIFSLAFSPNSRRLVSRSADATMRLWDIETGPTLHVLPCDPVQHHGSPQSVAITPDGQYILTGTPDGVRRWEFSTGKEQKRVTLPLSGVRVLATRPQDGLLAASGFGPNIVLFDPKTGRVRTLSTCTTDAPEVNIHSLAFSPDGRQLLVAGGGMDIQLWDIESGKLTREFPGHSSVVFAAIFHPDGQRIVSAGRDRTIRVWDPVHGDELAQLLGHTNYIFSLSFSPDGTTLASASGDATVRLWDTVPLKTRFQARRKAVALRHDAEK